jgi:hypothetical protein
MPNNHTTGALSRLGVALRHVPRFDARMPELTRRRSADHRHKCWHDVHVGTIAERSGNPHDSLCSRPAKSRGFLILTASAVHS